MSKNLKNIGCGFLALVIFFAFSTSCDLSQTITPPSSSTTTLAAQPKATSTPVKTILPIPSLTIKETTTNHTPTAQITSTTTTTDNASGIERQSSSNEILYREYTWQYQGDWMWELSINKASYDYYHQLPRSLTTNYSVYVTHPYDDLYIDMLAQKLKDAADKRGFSEFETVELATAFVQSLPYSYDNVTTPFDEYPRYPIETLVDNGGDCEDTAILLASIIDSMGYGVVLLKFPHHVAVGVKGGDNQPGTSWTYHGSKYYYLESTGENWQIGELPDEYNGMSASIYPLIPIPILTHEWASNPSGYFVELEVKIHNIGTAIAGNVYVYAGFDAGNNQVWNSKQSDPTDLEINSILTVHLYIKVPFDEHTRLVVQIVMDGYRVDESYSKWFDT
jgi:hypothetical protein